MWFYGDGILDAIPDDAIGFVYLITNNIDGREYVGKKLFRFKRTRVVKKKKVKASIESDWKAYWSSSDELKADVKKLGADNFTRRILRICYSKAECNFWELHYQIEHKVMLSASYNKWIKVTVHKTGALNGRKV